MIFLSITAIIYYYFHYFQMPDKNLFNLLGLSLGAPQRKVREAYRQLAKKYHPDLNPDNPHTAERFKEIAHAYWVLSDPARRKSYEDLNPHLRAETHRHQSTRTYRKDTPKETSRQGPREGKDILVRLYVTLEELAEGVMRKVKIRRRQPCAECESTGIAGGAAGGICPVCKGSGDVPDFTHRSGSRRDSIPCRKCGGSGLQAMKACQNCEGRGQILADITITVGVPPGSDDKEKIVVKSQGHQGFMGGKSGDLKVVIVQKEHPYFERKNGDLIYHCNVTFTQWLQGCELQAPSLNGPIALKLEPRKIPEGVLKVPGRGMPDKDGGKGDLVVKYSLAIPNELNRKQISLLKRLESTKGFSPAIDDKGWCKRATE
ncbi:hypothetical protein CEE37_14605 [candidate division LCP-89 bacterium B3_LCP]|uniref:Chaperone protein DnaJ n=1 Tax=candidate division LCP-89 bacterium B3_LCP TaxID=2012998 RepID=A0A532UPT3_UNCL8|nr:MAG: hypothetical protein CEE37_14605 [candidate division LCP-89 bacterium B3_LCP]